MMSIAQKIKFEIIVITDFFSSLWDLFKFHFTVVRVSLQVMSCPLKRIKDPPPYITTSFIFQQNKGTKVAKIAPLSWNIYNFIQLTLFPFWPHINPFLE